MINQGLNFLECMFSQSSTWKGLAGQAMGESNRWSGQKASLPFQAATKPEQKKIKHTGD